MEEMKNFIRLILPLLLIISFSSCATTGGVYNENDRDDKKLLFEDWKYRGFGYPLPEWFEAAYKGNVREVQKLIDLPKNQKIKIITAKGINSEQANKLIMNELFVKAEAFKLYDSCWVLLNKKEAAAKNKSYPYFAAAVIIIDNK